MGNSDNFIYNLRKIKVFNNTKEENKKDLIQITKLMYEKYKKDRDDNEIKENYNIEFGNIIYYNSFGFFLFLFIIVLFEFITNKFPMDHLIDSDYYNINFENISLEEELKVLDDLLISEQQKTIKEFDSLEKARLEIELALKNTEEPSYYPRMR